MDALALVLLTIPIFYPVVANLGYDPIWFGVMIVLVTQMGVITPPVGVCVYVVSGMERDVPLETIFRGCMPFLCGADRRRDPADPLPVHRPVPAGLVHP